MAIYLEKRAPVLSRRLQFLELSSQMCNASSAILAVAGLSSYVAIPIALSALLQSLIEYYALVTQVSACNTALRDVKKLMTWWESLSMIDRRARHSRAHAVQTCENAILMAISSRTTSVSKADEDAPTSDSGGDSKSK